VSVRHVSAPMAIMIAGLTLSGCAAIEGIFKAGVWTGVIIVVLLLVGVVALVSRFR
jgi:hypothetical protein